MQIEVCSKCGAEYEVTWSSIMMRDSDYERCDCGEVILRWNTAAIPHFKKIKPGKSYDAQGS